MPPLGIIAGIGRLPIQVAKAATARGQPVYIIRLEGFVEPGLDDYPGEIISFAKIGKIFKSLHLAGCEQVCFAGIVKRPQFSALKPDLKGMALLPKITAAARKGDDALLSCLITEFEAEGFTIIGADHADSNLLGAAGLVAGSMPDEATMADLRKAAHVAATIGQLDIGQGVIVCAGLVLCVEAQEGTDAMLARCAGLDAALRGSKQGTLGVLVKRPKPGQERRVDLPTIGLNTIEGTALAGLAGIGFEAGGTLLLDTPALLKRAEALGLFLYGFPRNWS